ncbi:MAG: ABC transporter permease [Victivallales bacterium]|nr:ABC transporter permease [Victivallales bacterium]
MARYFLRRILYFIPTLLGVNLFVFLLFFLVNTPDDMAKQALGEKASTPEQVLRWKAARGYDVPYFWNAQAPGIQRVTKTIFWQKSLRLLWGDFGASDMSLEPIGAELRRRIGPSLCLCVPIFLTSLFVNIVVAMLVASRHGTRLETCAQFLCVTTMSISALIYIIAGQFVFAKELKLVPVSGFLPGWDMLRFLALPVAIGVVGGLGSSVRFYQTLFLEEIGKDYVRTARAKGLPETRILFLHVLKNAMIPILTTVPVQMLMLIMGSLLLENFFSIPGMGGYTISAIAAQDFAVVRAMVFLSSVLYMVGLLLTDLCYALVDPRVRFS